MFVSLAWAFFLVSATGKSQEMQPTDTAAGILPATAALVPDTATSFKKWSALAVGGAHTVAFGGSLLVLNEAWYKGYPKREFHPINDMPEWQQVDKVGHTWSGYQLSRASYAAWRRSHLSDKKAVWAAGISGFGYLTVIELLDAYSAEWGWSWGDFAANVAGSGMFISQRLAWQEERISFKFSFHRMQYNDPLMNEVSNTNFGNSLAERMLKDYNGQTYWLSANLKSFFKQSKLPPWLNVAVGYGATGMFGAKYNGWYDAETGQTVDLTHIGRRRQWYLAPDIDFTRIPTRSKALKTVFYMLNAFKLPAPTLMLSRGKLTVYGLYF